jgi:hypothetical protein
LQLSPNKEEERMNTSMGKWESNYGKQCGTGGEAEKGRRGMVMIDRGSHDQPVLQA